jgi:hypothetical protein
MAETTLTQAEADTLLAMEKHRVDDTRHQFPALGGSIEVPLISINKRENFLLDVTRGRINLKKATYQNRARTVVILARLDIDGPPHENPDGQEIPCPHLHTYREGYGAKWAVAAPATDFPRTNDLWGSLTDFMVFCKITETPFIERDLFV